MSSWSYSRCNHSRWRTSQGPPLSVPALYQLPPFPGSPSGARVIHSIWTTRRQEISDLAGAECGSLLADRWYLVQNSQIYGSGIRCWLASETEWLSSPLKTHYTPNLHSLQNHLLQVESALLIFTGWERWLWLPPHKGWVHRLTGRSSWTVLCSGLPFLLRLWGFSPG